MGLFTEAPSTDRPPAVPESFHDLLAGFRVRLERALAGWLESRRQEAAAGESPEMVELAAPAFPRGGGELARCFSAMCQEVVGGQYLELLVAQRRAGTDEELLRVLRLKSGRYTCERPIQLGALLAGAPAGAFADLRRYGAVVGVPF